MAQAYTSGRGKNKMAKLGVRRDHQQNQERDLKMPSVTPMKFDGMPKQPLHGIIAGHLTAGGEGPGGSAVATRLRLADVVAKKQQAAASTSTTNSTSASSEAASGATVPVRCSYAACTLVNDLEAKLLDCASCHESKYCGRECQLADWSNHKARCKEIKKKRQEELETLSKLLGDTALST